MTASRYIVPLGLLLVVAVAGHRQFAAEQAEAPASRPASQPASEDHKERRMPHLRVDRRGKFVDVDAKVVLRDGDWIELLACMPGSREHESILTMAARPSHIHLALLMLGAEPGSPMMWKRQGDRIVVRPPRGPRVAVSIITKLDGKTVETKANQWIVNQKTGEVMPDNVWLFCGAGFVEWEGRQVYRADVAGSIISLVNFGDDVLARSTDRTSHDDDAMWGAHTKLIPPLDTEVLVRLRLLPKPPASQPAASQPAASQPAKSQPAKSQPAASQPSAPDKGP